MRVVSWNVNGIRAVIKKDAFKPFVRKTKPDIICLQETKAEQGQAEIDLPKFEEYWNSAEKKGYSGTAIFTKPKPIAVLNDFADHIFPEQAANWDYAMAKIRAVYLQKLEETKPVIFCGDMNVAHTEDDLANPKSNVGEHGFTDEERQGFQNFIDAGFVDTFRLFTEGNGHYSWWSYMSGARERNAGWRIDYFLVSGGLKDAVTKAEIHADLMGSDHCPVSVELDLDRI